MGKIALGIDIGAGSIKLVELEKTSEGIQLLRAKSFDLTQYAEQDKREALISKGISTLLKTDKTKKQRVAISLSGQSVFIRFLKLPKLQKGKIDKIIRYEAQQQVPFPLDKITWDHQIFRSGTGNEEDVLFVAAKKDIVEATLGHLSKADLSVELVDVSPLSILNGITYNEPLKKAIILDIGSKAANLIVVEDKGFWVRSILIAGDEMTRAVTSRFNLTFDKAEELKKKEGVVLTAETLAAADITPTARELANTLSPVVADLVTSIIQSLEFYKTKQRHDISINEMIICGGGSKLKGIEEFLSRGLGMQIRRPNIVQKIKCSAELRMDIDFQARFGAAIGLGLRLLQKCPTNIDLLPEEKKIERDFKKERLYIISAWVLAALIPLTLVLHILTSLGGHRSQIQYLNGLLSKYVVIQDEITSFQNQINALKVKVAPYEGLAVGRTMPLELLREISKFLPNDAWITVIKTDKDSVILEGETTASLPSVNEYIARLQSSPLFESAELLYAGLPKDSPETGEKISNFAIKMKFKKGL